MKKSKQLRQSQAEEILAKFENAGLGEFRDACFVRDMIKKLKAGKYPSKRQRDWLDSIIDKGLPQMSKEACELDARINLALQVEGLDFESTLKDFLFKLRCGYNLSEKQVAFCNKLIEKAFAIKDGSHWQPDDEMLQRMKLAVDVSVCYSTHYWFDRPGLCGALESVKQYINGNVSYVDEYRATRLVTKMMPKIKMLENPKFDAGDLCYINSDNTPGVIVAGPYVDRFIVYDVLAEGEIITCSIPKKRRS